MNAVARRALRAACGGRGRPAFQRSVAGFSLMEMVIGLGLGVLVLAAILQLFVGSRVTYTATEALARAQESGRFAIATISPSVRSVSLGGLCGGTARLRTHLDLSDDTAATLLSPLHGVRAWEYRNTGIGQSIVLDSLAPGAGTAADWEAGGAIGALPAAVVNLALPQSDVLLVRELRPIGRIAADTGNLPDQDRLQVSYQPGANPIVQCELILVTNCNQADLFQASSVNPSHVFRQTTGPCAPGNVAGVGTPAQFWSRNYGTATQFHRYTTRVFFIGQGVSGEPALFSATYGQGLTTPRLEELVDGIENMQLLFGYSYPGDASPPGDGQSVNQWLTAQTVPNWEYVVAVRIGLLARSPGSLGSGVSAQTFDLALTEVTHTPDTRLRQPHNVTLSLRNRQIIR